MTREVVMRYILVDGMNLFYRARYAAAGRESADVMVSMAFHIILNSIKSACLRSKADQVIFCMEGRSWRKTVYPEYKAQRILHNAKMTERELEDHHILLDGFEVLCQFLDEKTNITVLQNPIAEGDDLIAMWVQTHPEDFHTILSMDSDFKQLLAENVELFNGVDETITQLTGVYDFKGRKVIDKKTNAPKIVEDPEYYLFLKCVRGDKSDNIFSSYPGAYERRASKSKTSIMEAYLDRHNQGYAWSNFMLQRWTDHNDVEHVVRDKYNFNKRLIDLTMQPDEVKASIMATFEEANNKPRATNVGVHYMQFCNKWGLSQLLKYPNDMVNILNMCQDKEKVDVRSEPV